MTIMKRVVKSCGTLSLLCGALALLLAVSPAAAYDFDDDDDVIDAAMEPIDIDIYDDEPIIPVKKALDDKATEMAAQDETTEEKESASSAAAEKSLYIMNAVGGYTVASYDAGGEFTAVTFGGGFGGFFNVGGKNMLGGALGVSYFTGKFEDEDRNIDVDQSGMSIFVAPAYRYGSASAYFEAALPISIPVLSSDDDANLETGFAAEINGRYKFISAGVGFSFTETIIPISVRAHIPITSGVEIEVPFSYCIGDGWSGYTISGGINLTF